MSILWESIDIYSDPNLSWKIWKETFLSICNLHALIRRKRVRARQAPWLTSELKELMSERDKLKKIANRLNTEESWVDYKSVRNRVNFGIKSAKEEYFGMYFRENSKNIKKTWKGINTLLGNNLGTTSINNITYNNTNYTIPNEIANALNSHFTEIGPKLASQLPLSSKQPSDYISPTQYSFSIRETSISEVLSLIRALPTNKASGLDGISTKLLKEADSIIAPSLANLFNLSIRSGIFPREWKIAKVTPTYKDGTKCIPDNYGPISVLPAVTKLIERIIFNQLYSYLTKHGILSDSQSGFRPVHSTTTALLGADADDTSLTVAHSDEYTLEQLMNHDLHEIHSWLITNKLSLNVIKTKYMIVASHYRIKHLEHQFSIHVNHHYLTRDNSYKYLGVEIDQSLTWRDHVDNIAKKASGGIGALRRVRHLIPHETLITVYSSLVLPYFDYCSTVWGSCGRGMCDRLQVLQNRASRILTFSNYGRRSVEILDELGWDNLETRRIRQLATIVYKLINGTMPNHLTQIFTGTNSMYSYNLRNSTYNLFVPRPCTEAGKNSFHYRGAVLWNSLPGKVKGQTSLKSFLSHL